MIWEIDDRARTVEGLDADGRPRPEYAASLGLVRAPIGRRVLATVIEALVVVLLQLPLLLIVLPAVVPAVSAADPVATLTARGDVVFILVAGLAGWVLSTAFLLTQLILLGRRGVTLGKALTGLRVVNVRTLERPGFWRGAIVRYLVLCGSMIVPLLGPLLVIALSPFFDPARRGRSWPDLAAATWLVDVRRGLHPYDEKRMRIARKTVATDLLDVKPELPSLATPGAQTAAGAYVPLARNKGGVLGAVRSTPGPSVIGATDAADDEPRPDIPTTVAPAPFAAPAPAVAAVPPAVPAPPRDAPAAAVTPGAVVAPVPGAAAWTPPPLLGEPAPAPTPAAASEPPAPSPTSNGTDTAAGAAAAVPAPSADVDAPAGPAASAHPTVELTLDSGETIAVVGGGIVLGRAPAVGPEDHDVTPVPVADPSRSISKTHWALVRRGAELVAVERGSTNGSVLVRAGAEQVLEPGRPVEVRHGDTIRFGDRSAVLALR